MSKYTSIILFIPGSENEMDRIREVNMYKLPSNSTINLIDVNQSDYPDIFPRFIYCGTYKDFVVEKFIQFLNSDVHWEYPENVRVIVKEEESESLDYYILTSQ